jgi:hypothetical protein
VLAHRQPANPLPRNQPGEVLLLLRLVPVQHQLVDTQLAVRGIAQPNTTTRPAQLLHDHAVRLVAHGQAAVLLARRDAEEPCLTELRPHVVGERILAVCSRGYLLGDLAARKVLHALAQLVEVGLRGRREAHGVFGRGVADRGERCYACCVPEGAGEQTGCQGCHCECCRFVEDRRANRTGREIVVRAGQYARRTAAQALSRGVGIVGKHQARMGKADMRRCHFGCPKRAVEGEKAVYQLIFQSYEKTCVLQLCDLRAAMQSCSCQVDCSGCESGRVPLSNNYPNHLQVYCRV